MKRVSVTWIKRITRGSDGGTRNRVGMARAIRTTSRGCDAMSWKWIALLVAAFVVYRYRYRIAMRFPSLRGPLAYIPDYGGVKAPG